MAPFSCEIGIVSGVRNLVGEPFVDLGVFEVPVACQISLWMRRMVKWISDWYHFGRNAYQKMSLHAVLVSFYLLRRSSGIHCIGGCLEACSAAIASMASKTWRNSSAIRGAWNLQNSQAVLKLSQAYAVHSCISRSSSNESRFRSFVSLCGPYTLYGMSVGGDGKACCGVGLRFANTYSHETLCLAQAEHRGLPSSHCIVA